MYRLAPSRGGAACARLGDEYFLIGGNRNGVPSKEVWAWNFEANTWRRAPDLPRARVGAEATTMGGAIYVSGGHFSDDPSSQLVDDRSIVRLQNVAGDWQSVGELAISRVGNAMVSRGEEIFVVGGASRAVGFQGLAIERIPVSAAQQPP